MLNKVDEQYIYFLNKVLDRGQTIQDRTGVGTLSIFGEHFEADCQEGFPIITSKKMAWKQIVTELLWFLKGDTKLKYLLDNNCHIWDGDAYQIYKRACDWELDEALSQEEFIKKVQTDEQFAKTWGNLGPIYGRQWRGWNGFGGSIDQISNLIKNIKENPSSRRHLVSAWNVSDLKYMTLPPCHYAFQVYVRGDYLDLMWHQRSADLFLGVPFNISSYATLLHILAMATGKRAGKLKASFGDMHLYLNHTKAAIKQLDRKTYKLPEIHFAPTFYDALVNRGLDEALNVAETNMFKLLDYKYSPTLKAKLNN